MMDKSNYYDKKILDIEDKIEGVNRKCNLFSNLRLAIVIVAIAFGYFLYKSKSYTYMYSEIIICVLAFIFIAYMHSEAFKKKEWLNHLKEINEKNKKRANGSFVEFKDNGQEYLDVEHSFINDLDIFGEGSLFQWINTTTTEFGRGKLKQILCIKKTPSKEEILKLQGALKELASMEKFREEIECIGEYYKKEKGDNLEFLKWVKNRDESILNTQTTIISFVAPIALIGCFSLYLANILNPAVPAVLAIINFAILKMFNKRRQQTLGIMYDLKYKIKAYFSIIERIDKEEFKDPLLLEIKEKLANRGGESALKSLKDLNSLQNKMADTTNMMYIILNVLFLWDIHLLKSLEKWRIQNSDTVNNWFECLGDIEALNSISNLYFINEDWCTPKVSDKYIINSKGVGHPLIRGKRVCNDFYIKENEKTILITGSNMSGKSTFLRSIGLNMVLLYIGAPTCAESFEAPILNIYTCMRIGDNLKQNISSFYAEILRVKKLIEATNRGEKVFYLLDEIFKGTNSVDRHTGAKILIDQLCKKESLGFVSTHDLELCDLEIQNPKVVNYNFKEYYEGNEIKFDYKLRKGKSQTRNAIHLMKLAGIEIV